MPYYEWISFLNFEAKVNIPIENIPKWNIIYKLKIIRVFSCRPSEYPYGHYFTKVFCYMWKPPVRVLPRRLARHASRACLGVSSGCCALNCSNVSVSLPDTEHPSSAGADG